jgi:hypothetical protein
MSKFSFRHCLKKKNVTIFFSETFFYVIYDSQLQNADSIRVVFHNQHGDNMTEQLYWLDVQAPVHYTALSLPYSVDVWIPQVYHGQRP